MLRHVKPLLALVLVMVVVQRDSAFTLWGPLETWQTAALSYGARYWYSLPITTMTNLLPPRLPGNVGYTELGGPKDILQGSRLNAGIITYAYDPTFTAYYGVEGQKAVDAAFVILNRLPAASSASADLSEFITQGNQQINYTARALNMLDLKSTVLQILIEHMGLLGETHVFDLLSQTSLGAGACDYSYIVVMRNFDPITWNPSSYVNGTSYDYNIQDGCAAGIAIADAMEEVYDQPGGLSLSTSAVATAEALQIGGYYLGLTRDDFGGLRYLYRHNNYQYESMPPNTWVGNQNLSAVFSPIGSTNLTGNAAFTGLMGGVEKILFAKLQYNVTPGSTNLPTNVVSYPVTFVTNGTVQKVTAWRTNTAPDILFTAANMLTTTGTSIQDQPFTRTVTFIAPPATAGGAATTTTNAVPQVISPAMTVTLTDQGKLIINESPNFMQGSALYLLTFFQFGAFDGSTNPPIAFPQGTSIATLAAGYLAPPTGQGFATSPFNSILATNTAVGTGTTSGTVIGGSSIPTVFKSRPGGNSP